MTIHIEGLYSLNAVVTDILTSAAIKERVCMPWEAPRRPQNTAIPQQSRSRETSRKRTLTWLVIGVEGEKDSYREKKYCFLAFSVPLRTVSFLRQCS